MVYRIEIEAKDRNQRDAIERALKEPEVVAFVTIVGTLLPYSGRARARIMRFVSDQVAEEAAEGGHAR
jgi:hypothetical protein